MTLEDRFGRQRLFPLVRGAFLLEGRPVTLIRPAPASPARVPARSRSGSVARPVGPAKVAKASRIYVEGRHDAELVEQIWGDDLRDVGVVVEYLEGVDHLPAVLQTFAPGPQRRLGVLVDHLVPGSKEQRIAAAVTSPHVLVVGHPYVDIGGRSSRGAGHPGLAGGAARHALEGCCAPSAGARTRRPGGNGSWGGPQLCRPGIGATRPGPGTD